jgi:hypothetical protein
MKTKHILLFLFFCISCLCGAQTIDSSSICKADFYYYPDNRINLFAPGIALQFKDNSTGSVVSWEWHFSNSIDSVSTEQNPLHIYNYYVYSGPGMNNNSGMMPPIFIPNVTLRIKTSDGCISVITKQIYFNNDTMVPPPDKCYVYFNAYRSDSLLAVPESISYVFKTEAPANVIKWHWDFGDSTTSVEMNPVHIYPFQNAYYKVCVSIITSDSCINSYCSYVYVGKKDTTIVPECNASFTYQNLDSNPNYWYFKDNSTGNPTSWFWDFGDGTVSNEQTPVHVFRKDTIPDSLGYFHIVHSNGIFKVCLTTISGNICKSMYCDYINTNHSIDSSLINPCGYLINLVSSNILGSGSCKAKATASLIDSLGNPVPSSSYFWSNGSTSQSADNLCPNAPYYLVITSENGCKTAGSFAIMDYTKPYNIYGYWTVSGSGSAYNFNYALPDNTYTCSWVFNDSTVKTGSNVSYNFASPDSNNFVTVIVKNSSGNSVYSEKILLGQNAATGIKDKKAALLRVYPNPVQDELFVSMSNANDGVITMEVFDAVGRLMTKEQVAASGSTELRLNTSMLPAGFYILSISSKDTRLGSARFTK